MDDTILAAEEIAAEWNNLGIDYGVAHGLEHYPTSLGRDLDVIVRGNQIRKAEAAALSILSRREWITIVHRKPWAYWIFAFRNNQFLEVDLFDHIIWGPKSLAKASVNTYQKGSFKVDPWAGFIKKIFIQILGGNIERLEQKIEEIKIYSFEKAIIEEKLVNILGRALTVDLLLAIESKDLNQLTALMPLLRQSLLLNTFWKQRPIVTIITIFEWAQNELSLLFGKACSPIIALVSPDGGGKSTLLEHIIRLNLPFTNFIIRHWRPELLPPLARFLWRNIAVNEKNIKPRRKSGRFKWFRLFYYFVDFTIGYWWKDIRSSSKLQMILYDRCALDMAVDPVRYGLSSPRGTKLLWKLIPKPDQVILLYDTPERIVKRKAELSKEEVERQLKEWLKLAGEGKVDAIIRVDAKPEEIVRRLNNLVVEAFVGKNGGNLAGRMSSKDTLNWIGSILTNGSKSKLRFGLNCKDIKSSNNIRKIAEFAVAPNTQSPRFLIPLGSKKVASASLKIYNAQRSPARLVRKLLSASLRLGLFQSIMRDRFSIFIHPDEKPTKEILLQEQLKEVLGKRDISIALSTGTQGSNRKPVIQMMDGRGEILGYVKIGWNQKTITFLKNEERVLMRLNGISFKNIVIPSILYAGSWNDKYILIVSSPRGKLRTSPRHLTLSHLELINKLSALDKNEMPLSKSNFWCRLDNRKKHLDELFPYYAHILEWGMESIDQCFSDIPIPFGWKHGDLAPWNAYLSDEHLFIYDWEYAQEGAPPGWDIFHFMVYTGVLLYRWKPKKIFLNILKESKIKRYIKRIGFDKKWIIRFFTLYLLDILSLELERSGLVGDSNQLHIQKILSCLLAIALLKEELSR